MTTPRTRRGRVNGSTDPVRAPGKRRRGPAPRMAVPQAAPLTTPHRQPWVPTSGLVGRTRRSARRG